MSSPLTLVAIIILFYLFLKNQSLSKEGFIFNQSSGTTRNMCKDIRGCPPNPFMPGLTPWNNPTAFPIQNRRMIME